jgi:hypothetical protein
MSQVIATAITVATTTVAIIVFVFKEFLKKKLNEYFDSRLEKYKAELKLLARQVEFDYSRKEVAFSLFFTKKHEAYIKFYDLVTNANGVLRSLYGYSKATPIEMMRTPDIADTMKKRGCSEALIADYIQRIEKHGIDSVEKDLNQLMRSIDFSDAERACWDAKNYLIVSRLYFDKDLYDIVISLCNEMLFLQSDYEMAFTVRGGGNREEQKKYIKNIDQKLEDTIRFMQTELGVGYFNA